MKWALMVIWAILVGLTCKQIHPDWIAALVCFAASWAGGWYADDISKWIKR